MITSSRQFKNIAFALVSATFIGDQSATAKDLRPHRLTANTPELAVQAAALAPDGKSIAYAYQLGIHLRNLANGETHLLAGTAGHLLLRWTPDGSGLVARVQDTGGTVKTVIVSPTGGAATPASETQQAVPSPGGKQIALISKNPPSLSVQDAAGANKRELWKGSAESSLDQFQWSPSGTQIAVLSSSYESSLELFRCGER